MTTNPTSVSVGAATIPGRIRVLQQDMDHVGNVSKITMKTDPSRQLDGVPPSSADARGLAVCLAFRY